MGCGQSIDADAAAQNQHSRAIDEELKRARAEEACVPALTLAQVGVRHRFDVEVLIWTRPAV